jgi:hypothetical protein
MMEERKTEWNDGLLLFCPKNTRPERTQGWERFMAPFVYYYSILPYTQQTDMAFSVYPLAAVKYLHLLEKVDMRRL